MDRNERREWNRRDYERRTQRCFDYLGGACAKCGSTNELQFDHVDPSTKTFTITGNVNRRWDALVDELDKCQLLCKLHHDEKTRANGENTGGGHNRIEPPHGTMHSYQERRCRCGRCRTAGRQYRRGQIGYHDQVPVVKPGYHT